MKTPILVSYPRSGAHWLKTILLLHHRPLIEALIHGHDNDLLTSFSTNPPPPLKSLSLLYPARGLNPVGSIKIYAYRDPVEVMFSMLEYYRPFPMKMGDTPAKIFPLHWDDEPTETQERLSFWMKKWNSHIRKWTSGQEAAEVDIYIRYPDIPRGAERVLTALGIQLDPKKLNIDREEVRTHLKELIPPTMPPFDRERIMEKRDPDWSTRREHYNTNWAPLVRQLNEFDLSRLPQT